MKMRPPATRKTTDNKLEANERDRDEASSNSHNSDEKSSTDDSSDSASEDDLPPAALRGGRRQPPFPIRPPHQGRPFRGRQLVGSELDYYALNRRRHQRLPL